MLFLFFIDTPDTEIYTYFHTLALPGALPIYVASDRRKAIADVVLEHVAVADSRFLLAHELAHAGDGLVRPLANAIRIAVVRELALPPPDEHRDDEVMHDAIFEGWRVNFARFRVIRRAALHWPRMPRSAIDPPLQVGQPANPADPKSAVRGQREKEG